MKLCRTSPFSSIALLLQSPQPHNPNPPLPFISPNLSLRSTSQLHGRLTKLGISNLPPHCNQLISLYSKHCLTSYAHKLFNEITDPDIISFSSLISCYSKNQLHRNAFITFRAMRARGVSFNEFTVPTLIKSCTNSKNILMGAQIHAMAIISSLDQDVFVTNALITMYASFGLLNLSKKLFDDISHKRNIVSWNGLLTGYARNEKYEEALNLFTRMVMEGIEPNEFGFSCVVNSCTELGHLKTGQEIHGFLTRLGYNSDPFTVNSLLDMYAKLGELTKAEIIFKNVDCLDVISWNAFIAGCVLHGQDSRALQLLKDMRLYGIIPNFYTFSSILKACANIGELDLGKQIHGYFIKADPGLDPYVGSGLVDMYAKTGFLVDSVQAFNAMQEKDLFTWNALISGFSHNKKHIDTLNYFSKMRKDGFSINRTTLSAFLKSTASLEAKIEIKEVHALIIKLGFLSDPHVVNGLIDSYGKCDCLADAGRIFYENPLDDVITFTSMISSFSQGGQGEEAIKLFLKMLREKLEPDSFVLSSLLNACASLSLYEQGKQMHAFVIKMRFLRDEFTGNALVNMYSKCGNIEEANLAFNNLQEKGVVSWSAMISGLAQHGQGKKALDLFKNMVKRGVKPNNVTMTSVLYACSHTGLVKEGKEYFDSMKERFGIERTQEHYACMVDLLGRAGKLKEAMELITKMPLEPNSSVWGALLGAARVHGNTELGIRAADKLFTLEPDKSGTHVILANIFASSGKWYDVACTRRLMREKGVKKEPAVSWIELRNEVHKFIVGDRSHVRSKEIYAKLEELGVEMEKLGYKPDLEADLHDVGRREKEVLLSHHSERLVVAFGLISTPDGVTIRVKKNIRVCKDCHVALKYISKIVKREIVIRDINRFHHFRDGNCSCNDYW
ncbi:hypothetical protein LUZ60_015856 [Juncus effusus]|nr:hypothetical protein LUZ60_015856 [Juncus effusus]